MREGVRRRLADEADASRAYDAWLRRRIVEEWRMGGSAHAQAWVANAMAYRRAYLHRAPPLVVTLALGVSGA